MSVSGVQRTIDIDAKSRIILCQTKPGCDNVSYYAITASQFLVKPHDVSASVRLSYQQQLCLLQYCCWWTKRTVVIDVDLLSLHHA